MKLSGILVYGAALASLAADKVFGEPLTTIEPCPDATTLSLAPITVSAQYQPVSTCEPTTACIKGKCSTIYPFTTYPYVSTVVPYAWNGTTTQTTTVTQVNQLVTASEHLETLTRITAAPSINKRNWFNAFKQQQSTSEEVTIHETVTRRAVAPFSAIGPLAIPGWGGSGLCNKCVQDDGSRSQLFAVIECRSGTSESGQPYQNCLEWYETLIEQPSTSVPAEALCSSTGPISQAGIYTWTFPQVAPPVTITRPPVSVTITLDGQPTITVQPNYQIIPDQPWNAYVTKSFQGPTTFNFEIFVTKVFVWDVPLVTSSAESSRNIPLPTASPHSGQYDGNGWWPLPEGDTSWTAPYVGDHVWEDWIPTSSVAVTANSNSIDISTSTSVTSAAISPISGSTSSSSGSTTVSTTLSSSASTFITASTSRSSSSYLTTVSASSSNSAISASSSSSSLSSSVSGETSGTSSITTTSGTSTSSIVPSGTGFYLRISGTPVTGLLPRQTVVQYVGFDSNNEAIAVDGLSDAAEVFKGNDNTTFISDDQFLGTATFKKSLVQRFLDSPKGYAVWDIIGAFAHLRNTAGFCFDNGLIYTYTDSDICNNPINIIPTNPSTTSTTSATSTSTFTRSTSTSSSTTASPSVTSTSSALSTSSSTSTISFTSGTSIGTQASSTLTTNGPFTASSTLSASSASAESSSSSSGVPTASTSTSSPATAPATSSSNGAITSTSNTEPSSTTNLASSASAESSYTSTVSSTGTPSFSSTGRDSSVSSFASTGIASPSSTSTSGTLSFLSTSSSPSTIPVASTTTFSSSTPASVTTSGGTTTTTSATSICNLNADVCLNSQLITANTVASVNCPLLDGVLCTVDDLLALVPQLLGLNPSIATVLIGNNEVLGLSITPEEVSAAINAGELNGVCDALGGPVSVILRDPTCPIPPATTSLSSTTTTSTGLTSSLSTTTIASASSSTSTPQSTTLTTTVTATTTSSATTTTTTTSASPICNLNVNVCLNSALITANSVATYDCPLLDGLLCTTNDLLAAVPQLLSLNPNIASVLIGNNELIGLSLTPEEVSAAVAAGELSGVCDALGGPVSVILDDPTCPDPDTTTATTSTSPLFAA